MKVSLRKIKNIYMCVCKKSKVSANQNFYVYKCLCVKTAVGKKKFSVQNPLGVKENLSARRLCVKKHVCKSFVLK